MNTSDYFFRFDISSEEECDLFKNAEMGTLRKYIWVLWEAIIWWDRVEDQLNRPACFATLFFTDKQMTYLKEHLKKNPTTLEEGIFGLQVNSLIEDYDNG